MPANLKDLRSRIKSVKNTQQITKAMKLVSAAKFGRAQQNVVNGRPYAENMQKLVSKLSYFTSAGSINGLMDKNDSKNTLVLVVSSDRGLCGGYNTNIAKCAQKTIDELKLNGEKVYVVGIGKKSFLSLLRKKRIEEKNSTIEEPPHLSEKDYHENPDLFLTKICMSLISTSFQKPSIKNAEGLGRAIKDLYSSKKIGKIVVVYSKFVSAMTQNPIASTILPLKPKPEDYFAEPIFDPSFDDLLEQTLPRYLTSQIFIALLNASASEHGARMSAMENATKNAKDMERRLQITYQRARQAAITNELIEIISGAEAI